MGFEELTETHGFLSPICVVVCLVFEEFLVRLDVVSPTRRLLSPALITHTSSSCIAMLTSNLVTENLAFFSPISLPHLDLSDFEFLGTCGDVVDALFVFFNLFSEHFGHHSPGSLRHWNSRFSHGINMDWSTLNFVADEVCFEHLPGGSVFASLLGDLPFSEHSTEGS